MANFFDQFDSQGEVAAGPGAIARPPSDNGVVINNGIPRITITKYSSPAADAISSIESGGNYRAVGPVTRDGDRAFGKYQVMGKNIGPWSQEVFGQPVTIGQFLSNPQIQDAIFQHKFEGQYVPKYGPEGAARAWFAGEGGMNDPSRRDVNGTTVADYSRKFSAAAPSVEMSARQGGNFFDQFDGTTQAAAEPAPTAPALSDRFADGQKPAGDASAMQSALEAKALEMSRGAPTTPSQQMDLEQSNLMSAASQGTTPNMGQYGGKLVSSETFQDETGAILYRDPATGEVKPTDSKTQVALRDPRDNTVKVFSRSPDTNEMGITGAARVLAPGLTAGAPTARPGIPGPSLRDMTPRASDIMATAKPFYKAFKNEAGKIEVPAETAVGIAERIKGALGKANLIPELAPPVYSAMGILEKGGVTTLDDLQNVKRVVGRSFNSPDKNIRDAASVASREINKVISEVSKSAGESLRTADQIHSTALSVQELQRKAGVADLRAGRAGYGGNAVNSMRQVLSPIVEASIKGRVTGFKPDEIKAMRDIVEGTTATNVARQVGAMSPSKGIMQIAVGGATGGVTAAIGAAANKLATVLTAKQIERLNELVAKRSPAYAEGVARAVKRYEEAQAAFTSNPAPNKFAAYVSASRALSKGLTHDGIAVTSGDLLRSIQGPAKSAAEDQQQPVPGRPSE